MKNPPGDPRFRTGSAISLSEVQEIADKANAVGLSSVTGGGSESHSGGFHISLPPEAAWFIRVIEKGTSPSYPEYFWTWETVTRNAANDDWEVNEQGPFGLYSSQPAIEIQHNTNVPPETVWRAFLGDDGDSVWFSATTPTGGGGDDVTVNFTGGSIVNIDNSTLNIIEGSTLNVDDLSTINIGGNLLFPPVVLSSFTGDQTDLNIGVNASWIHVSADQHYRHINSITGGVHGRLLAITNTGTKVILIDDDTAALGTAENRIQTSTMGAYFYLSPRHTVVLRYIGLDVDRWRVAENSKEWLGHRQTYVFVTDSANVELNPLVEVHVFYPDAEGYGLTGFKGGIHELCYTIRNGANDVGFWLRHNDVTSDAENRMFLPNGDHLYIPPRSQVKIQYDRDVDRWRVYYLPPSLTATHIGYGSSGNALTGTSDLVRLDEGVIGLERQSDTQWPGLETYHTRAGDTDTDTDDVIGSVSASCKLTNKRPHTEIVSRYIGVGGQDGGQLEFYTVDSLSVFRLALTLDDLGDVFIGNADTASRLLGTGTVGEVVNILLGSKLDRVTNTLVSYGDMMSAFDFSEVSVTTTTSLNSSAFGKMHVISGTTSNYTVTLPTVSGNAGKLIGFRIHRAATKLFTISGNGGIEVINGSPTRPMWNDEVAILFCDGSEWFKLVGRAIPMVSHMQYNVTSGTYQSMAHNTNQDIPINASLVNNTSMMSNTGSNQIDIIRSSQYHVTAQVTFCGSSSGATLSANASILSINMPNGVSSKIQPGFSGTYSTIDGTIVTELASGANCKLSGYQNSGVAQNAFGGNSGTLCWIVVAERPTW